MRCKLLFLSVLLYSQYSLACFKDTDCPMNNVCIKTGYIAGICQSQAMPQSNIPYAGSVPMQTTTTVTTTQSTGTTTSPITNQLPALITPGPVIAGPCTNDINCPQGFACSRPGGVYRGVCMQIAQ